MNVTLGYHVNGSVHASEVYDSAPDGALVQAFAQFHENDVIDAKVRVPLRSIALAL
jgi:hypothetical protein